MTIHDQREVFVEAVTMATVAAGTSEELPVFVAPFDCFLERLYFVNAAAITGHNTNYSIISFQRKGTAGTGTDEITTKSFLVGTDAAAFVPLDIAPLHKDYRFIPKGTAVTYKKVHASAGIAFTDFVLAVVYSRAPGGIHENRDYNGVYVSNVHTPDLGADALGSEFTIFVAPFDCFIDTIYATGDETDTPKLDVWKGPHGDALGIIADFASACTARVPKDLGALDKANRYIPKGTAVTVSEDNGTGDLIVPVFTTVFRRA